MPFATGRDALPRDPAPHVQRRCKCNNRRSYWCTKSEAGIAALLRILAGCAARGGSIPAVVFDRRATKHPAKIRAALRVGAAPAPRGVAGSLNRAQLFASPAPKADISFAVIHRRAERPALARRSELVNNGAAGQNKDGGRPALARSRSPRSNR